ncbi:MAG: hypothetical protein UU71_C0013G0039 [Parcubacteria group bacterium GW2011_GWB1_41_6]|nr:MAG: hypothetical protein UU71_C0013G0039 [Parcubacteria group bacterium GW2011_GWB1_41_6]KKS34661.1 MAG: hypothetical protein UU96_C0001G0016 [Parcubacteria group bacterium GW2011_GWC2_42_13]KKS58010.1 MAG: hypothetical protein UV22_C0008G0026 [Parcubacteria group bacterium GW2011_GWA2_42_35]
MKIIHTDDFKKALSKSPEEIKHLFEIREERFKNNWTDPRLHIKKVRFLNHVFSLRITRRYRVFFYFQNSETAIFFEIGHRKDIYRK